MPNEKKPSDAPTASEAPASKPSARPLLDTPFTVKHESSRAPGKKPTPAPDSLGAAVDMFADSVARSAGSLPFVSPSAPPPSSQRTDADVVKGLLTAMDAALRDGDHERAVRAADLALRKQPRLAVALMCKRESSRVLEVAYLKRIGPLAHVPRVRIGDIEHLHLDGPSKFVLSLVDGAASFASVMTVSCMDRLVVLRVLDDLLARGVNDRGGAQ
jgi:hypothetical protein